MEKSIAITLENAYGRETPSTKAGSRGPSTIRGGTKRIVF